MPKGQNLSKARQPKEVRLRLLGLDKPLEPGERSIAVRLRLPERWAEKVLRMSAEERGRVFMAGVKVLEVEHAETDQ